MSASAARRAAREVVTRVREREAYAHETMNAVLAARKLEARDAGFATRLAYGTIATRGVLDEAVMRGLKPGTGIEPLVMDALCVGAYEILYLATARHAAVSETVELVKEVRPKAAGLANAAMRRLVESADDFPWGDTGTDDAALARAFGHPEWLVELLVSDIGHAHASEMLVADIEPAPFFVAALPHVLDAAALAEVLTQAGAEPATCELDGCVRASVPAAARSSSAIAERKALVMDAGAQLAVAAADQAGGGTVVEIGAGRGSKSLLLASRAAAAGRNLRLVAVDLHAFKLEGLAAAAESLGLAVETVTADATSTSAGMGIEEGTADVVLVDAPCSGLGTLRRHPDRIWRARPEEIEELARLGEALLKRCASLVKRGGFVVYSTCTVARRENEDVIEGFLGSAAGCDFERDPLGDLVPAEWVRFVSEDGSFRSYPTVDGPDGHFVTRLRRVR